MEKSDSPFEYLRVIPPDKPKGNIRSPEVTADRIARHVAVVFGVDVPENPANRTWVADYERLRVNEIAQGALTEKDGGGATGPARKDGLDVIATATLQKFGPDNKAAIILTGCEVLFSSIVNVFHDVLGILRISDDNRPVATPTIFAAWSLLVKDAFLAQPALLAAAMQARAAQSKTSLEWRMAPTSLTLAPSEQPRAYLPALVTETSPQELSILDRVLLSETSADDEYFSLGRGYAGDANRETVIRSLINNWCFYLTGSSDQAFAWISTSPGKPQHHRSEAILPLSEPSRTFVSDVLAVFPDIQPKKKAPDWRPPSVQEQDWVRFTQSMRSDDGTNLNEEHTDRLLPRMYSLPEIWRLEPRSQRALLNTHMEILQLYRNADDFTSAYLRERAKQDAETIVQYATRLWGDEDPMTAKFIIHASMMDLIDQGEPMESVLSLELSGRILEKFSLIHEAWRAGVVPDNVWIRTVNDYSSDLREAVERIEKSDKERGAELQVIRHEYWRSVVEDTGIRDAWNLWYSELSDSIPLTSVHALFHNYQSIPFRSSDTDIVKSALRFSMTSLIPLRRRVSLSRKNDYAYRTTLQVTVRALYNLLAQKGLAESEEWLIEAAAEVEDRLLETSLGDYHFQNSKKSNRDLRRADLNFLGSLARIQVSLLMHRHRLNKPFDQLILRSATTIRVAWEAYSSIHQKVGSDPDVAPIIDPGARRFSEITEYESSVSAAARAESSNISPEANEYVNRQLSRAREVRNEIRLAQPAPGS